MRNGLIIFVISAVLGFGGGYFFFQLTDFSSKDASEKVSNTQQESSIEETETVETVATANSDIFSAKGCLGCHAVEGLGLQGGATGPDLTHAYENVESKHGKPIEEFLKEPTSAVMSGVISGNPLTDEQISKIVEALKEANQK
ncbi:cytochrome C [Bacillus sp. HMF5848]|uniref:c-type cytochrome n=1 Tax=Bacillus sp. HMF5848 TaxID=2495421 RepID=UPI000F7ACCE5|nr:c-type cytochrome [Bacillus sp. HMF5848]RSK26598.1 cytochrome C [Bacillus sp. HMF5848]